MAILYVMEQGAIVHKRNERIAVTKNGHRLNEVPAIKIDQLVLFGNVGLTTPAITFLLSRGIDTVFLSSRGKYRGRLQPAYSANFALRKRQIEIAQDKRFCLDFSKAVVDAKIRNARTRCLRLAREKDINADKAIRHMDKALLKVAEARDLDELRGIEGSAARRYYAIFKQALDETFDFKKRVRRPPSDPVNVLLSLAYTLLFNQMYSYVNLVGLDPYQGFYHRDRYGRPSLPLDLMEEFRVMISDAVVQTAINKKVITPNDYDLVLDRLQLSGPSVKKFLSLFSDKLNSNITHPNFGYETTYGRCIELQARIFAKLILGEIADYRALILR